ncbi:hypothetical protein EOM86_11990, partial [Candidatus Nomurabacteria bacterium]|nr:hypothetical protein [Candidatus Nomurabacteria bacterium]
MTDQLDLPIFDIRLEGAEYHQPFFIAGTHGVLDICRNSFDHFIVNGRLDDSFHFVFAIYHLCKHFMNSGVGFRQFVDVAVLIKNDDRINWMWTENKLKEIGDSFFL